MHLDFWVGHRFADRRQFLGFPAAGQGIVVATFWGKAALEAHSGLYFLVEQAGLEFVVEGGHGNGGIVQNFVVADGPLH